MTDKKDLEEGTTFTPKFNDKGLIPCITQSAITGKVLMMAWMNEDALNKTLETGEMHYWSRSRNELWHKGATSGDIQTVIELQIDCDQDCLLAIVNAEKACHTGRESCFYRVLDKEKKLSFKD